FMKSFLNHFLSTDLSHSFIVIFFCSLAFTRFFWTCLNYLGEQYTMFSRRSQLFFISNIGIAIFIRGMACQT
ncbi:hypothetical protein VIGAN_01550600, partial [Vigna angularis var. angularis]